MRSIPERVAVWLAVASCLLFVAGLVDVGPRAVAPFARAAGLRDATLHVNVREHDQPASSVRVRAFAIVADQAQLAGEATTAAGRATLEHLPSGETWVVAEREGLARASSRLVLSEGERTLDLALGVGEEFEVVVVDGGQRPIHNAKVLLHGGDPLPHAAYTDRNGLAAFVGLGVPPYAVEASAGGFGRKVVRELGAVDSPLFLKLEREAELTVDVVDPEGKPAENTTVMVSGSGLWPARTALSDAAGRVLIAGLPRGFYELRAQRGSQVSEPGAGLMLEQGEHGEIELRLVEGEFVRVFVSDGEGEPVIPIAQADVALVEGGLSPFPLYGRTANDGTVRLGPIVGGDVIVSAQAPGFVAKSGVVVEQGQSDVRVPLIRGGTLLGRVVDDRGFPIAGAELEAIGMGLDGMPIADSSMLVGFRRDHFAFALPGASPLVPAGELGVMPVVPGIPSGGLLFPSKMSSASRGDVEPWVSRRDGTFELRPVTPGRVQLIARHPAYVESLSRAVSIDPAGRAEIEVVMQRGGALEGRVLETNRTAVAAARVELVSPDGVVERITYSADDGSFGFAAVPADVVIAIARAEEPETIVERLSIEVQADRRRELEIVLPEKRQAVAMRVVDDRGFPIDRAEIRVTSLEPRSALSKTLFSDDGGEARLQGGRGLPLRMTVRRRGHAPLVTEVDYAPADLVLTLAAEVVADGEVHSRDGWLAGARVVLLTAAGDRHATSNASGRFQFNELAAGMARMLVTADGYAFDERTVTIESDPSGRVSLGTIELERGGSIEGVVVDERGDPVLGARVAVGRVPTYLPLGPLPPGVAETNGAGGFVLKDLERGVASVEAYKDMIGRSAIEGVDVRIGERTRDVRVVLLRDLDRGIESKAPASLAVTLSETTSRHGPAVLLAHVPYGGEAQHAGLFAGDQLMAVDGLPLRSLEHAREKLDGPSLHDMVLELYRPKLGRFKVRVRRETLRR